MTSNIARALEELERGVTQLAARVGWVSDDIGEAFEELKASVREIRQAAVAEQTPADETALRRLLVAIDALEADPSGAGLRTWLVDVLHAYELTGDHDHGSGPIKAGRPCSGGDCLVHKARRLLGAV